MEGINKMSDIKWDIFQIIVPIGLCILMVLGVNSCSASDWNNGVCPNCGVRYELRGISNGISAYVCPECGKEVRKY